MSEKLERYKEKGMEGRRLKTMIVGIPNVGKSSLINRLAGSKKAKVEDRPGVTLNKQWIPTSIGLDLLDMPGVLWPKFEDVAVGENLALTGAIRDQILDIEEMAMILCSRLMDVAPKAFCERYRLSYEQVADLDGYDIFEAVGRKRGFLISGGEVNAERTATMLLDEFRGGVIGRISLEKPAKVIGKNTVDCMRSGMMYGTAAMIDGLVERIEEELGHTCTLIATGGMAQFITPLCRREVILEKDLLLKGLNIIYKKNKKQEN